MMNKQNLSTTLLLTLLIMFTPEFFPGQPKFSGLNAKPRAVDVNESREVLEKAYNKYKNFYNRYSGVRSRRVNYMREYDADSGQKVNFYESTIIRTQFFYKPPVVKPISLKINGTSRPISEFKKRKEKSFWPIFDVNGRKNYNLKINKIIKFRGKDCYVISVIPRQKTEKHVRGQVFMDAKTLNIEMFSGTTAVFSTGVKDISFKLYFKNVKGWPVVSHGSSYVRVYFPLVQPHRKLKLNFKASGHRLVPR